MKRLWMLAVVVRGFCPPVPPRVATLRTGNGRLARTQVARELFFGRRRVVENTHDDKPNKLFIRALHKKRWARAAVGIAVSTALAVVFPAGAWASTDQARSLGVGAVLRAFGAGVLVFAVVQSARMRARPAKRTVEQFRGIQTSYSSVLDTELPPAVRVDPPPPPAPPPEVQKKTATTTSAAEAAEQPAAPPQKKPQQAAPRQRSGALGGLFSRKKSDRSVRLEELLTQPKETTSVDEQQFAVAVAGCLLADLPEVELLPAALAEQVCQPWVAKRAEAAAERELRARETWRAAGKAVSYFDVGLATTETAKARRKLRGPSPAQWLSVCGDLGVTSHFDFGVRETAASKSASRRPDVDSLRKFLGSASDLAPFSEVFANVVNAVLVPLVDAAVATLKDPDDSKSIEPLGRVVGFASQTSTLFEELGLPYVPKPVVYEGKATKGQLQSLFSRYAAAAVASGLDDAKRRPDLSVEDVDVLQMLFAITDKRAQKLADQVVGKLVSQMLDQTAANPDLASLLGGNPADKRDQPSDAEIDAQLDQLKQAIDSGQLSKAEREEIKNLFASMLGGQDVNAALDAAQQNYDKLDPRSRKALDLLKQVL